MIDGEEDESDDDEEVQQFPSQQEQPVKTQVPASPVAERAGTTAGLRDLGEGSEDDDDDDEEEEQEQKREQEQEGGQNAGYDNRVADDYSAFGVDAVHSPLDSSMGNDTIAGGSTSAYGSERGAPAAQRGAAAADGHAQGTHGDGAESAEAVGAAVGSGPPSASARRRSSGGGRRRSTEDFSVRRESTAGAGAPGGIAKAQATVPQNGYEQRLFARNGDLCDSIERYAHGGFGRIAKGCASAQEQLSTLQRVGQDASYQLRVFNENLTVLNAKLERSACTHAEAVLPRLLPLDRTVASSPAPAAAASAPVFAAAAASPHS